MLSLFGGLSVGSPDGSRSSSMGHHGRSLGVSPVAMSVDMGCYGTHPFLCGSSRILCLPSRLWSGHGHLVGWFGWWLLADVPGHELGEFVQVGHDGVGGLFKGDALPQVHAKPAS